jgi:hypothetical protein
MPNITPIDEATKALAKLDVSPPAVGPIKSNDDYEEAAGALREIVEKKRILEDERKKVTRPIDAAKKSIMDLFKEPLGKLERRETAIRTAMADYSRELVRIQREEQARLRDEQAKLAAAAQEEAARHYLNRRDEQAEAVLENIPPVPTVIIDKPKVSGMFGRDNWKFEVVDMLDLVIWACENNPGLIIPNEKMLGELARSTKGQLTIPGVRFYSEEGLVIRR